MDNVRIDKEQAQGLMKEVLEEIEKIRRASNAYCAMVNREYGEYSLHFLKELSYMFERSEEHNGIGAQAIRLAAVCRQVNDALEEYSGKKGKALNTEVVGF